MATAPHIRLTDDDREQVSRRLQAALTAGQLDLAEFEERLDRTYAAKVRGDLDDLTSDLVAPAPVMMPATAPVARGGRGEPPALARVGALAAIVVLAITVSPAFFWLLWFAVPFAAGRGHRRAGPGGGHCHDRRGLARDEELVRA